MVTLARLPNEVGVCDKDVGRRQEPRVPIAVNAKAAANGGETSITRLINVSQQGCMIASPQPDWRVGQFIAISLHGIGTIHGILRWVEVDRAGVEFSHRIPDVALFAFEQRHPQTTIRRL